MKVLIGGLRVFAYIWVTLAALLVLVGLGGIWMKDGFFAMLAIMSPWNVLNFIVMAITFVPGVGALICANKLEIKLLRKNVA